jgi:hypothetical protein
VAWQDSRTTLTEIRAQALDPSGALVAPTDVLALPSDTHTHANPAAAANPYCGNAAVVAVDYAISNQPVLLIGTLGTCTPAYTLLSFKPDVPNGVTAGTTAGDAFTFRVAWWGASLPTQAELWIDLDQNGTAGATKTRVWPMDPAGGARWAGVAALCLLVWSAWARRRAVFAGAVALSLLAGGLIACSSSGGGGGGGGGGETPAPTVTEKFTMTGSDAEDTNPVDGKEYTVTVTIPAAGSYAYKLVFSDGTTAAIGKPATVGTLTVN